ncbi:MAG: glycerol kinase GlpK [Deltaproteobacteria bacterium]|nr:glycerol kinase GlpK [Deltaproteobacteria bacterium]
MPDVILSIDQGTTGTTAMLMDTACRVLARGYQEFPQIYPRPGWVEHDPQHIWESVEKAVSYALAKDPEAAKSLRAVGITNQRETAVMWDKNTGKPLYNAIVWQCRRTADKIADLKEKGLEPAFVDKTGLILDPYFSGTKFAWLLENAPGVREEAEAGRAAAGTVDSFLVYKLTGGVHVTDASNASRTLLMNLKTQAWDDELCGMLGVPRSILPEIVPCAQVYGTTKNVPGLPDGIPVCGMAGDQQAALFGQACFSPGEAKCTYGTGAFLLMNTGTEPVKSRNGLLTTVAWKTGDKTIYALEGSVFMAGAVVQWLRDGLGLIKAAPEVEALAGQVPDTGGVTLVPAFTGLGAPHWKPAARGLICGMTRGTTAAHIARAALEGIALQNVEILKAMEADSGKTLVSLKADGGAAANNLLMQMQANFLGRKIIRPQMLETTALGAAFLAGLGAGLFQNTGEIARVWQQDREFTPRMDEQEREEILTRWEKAVEMA